MLHAKIMQQQQVV